MVLNDGEMYKMLNTEKNRYAFDLKVYDIKVSESSI